MGYICGDNRFEIIKRAKKDIIEKTNIESDEDEIRLLDIFLFRCWQMGWLDKYNNNNYDDDKENELYKAAESFCYEKINPQLLVGYCSFIRGAEWADEHPILQWIDASLSKPKQDVEVIVLLETISEGCYKIAFGHIVDKSECVDYNGWNIDGVRYWLPCPELPNK